MERRPLHRALGLFVSLALVAAFAAGCSSEWLFPQTPQTTVHPDTDAGRIIQDVYAPITWIMVVIFVAVEGVLLYTVLRFRRRPGDAREAEENPEQIHGNTALEIGWTLIPVVIVVALAFPTLQALWALADTPSGEDPYVVKVTGKQWWWEFEYPDYPGERTLVTANELHLPAGELVRLDLTSDNVIHSFWVPKLSGKRDLVPGRVQSIWFTTPEEPGVYDGQCAELCGASHALMRFKVFVDAPEDFERWAKRQAGPAVAEASVQDPGPAAMLAGGCVSCHKIDFPGSPFQQRQGPTLTHVGSRETIAGAVLENNPENMERWIRHAPEVKPGSTMPSHDWMSDEQIQAIVAYLQELE